MSFINNISPNSSATDKELIDAFKKSNDVNCLGILYQRYMDLVLGVCLKYFKDIEKSKDAMMDIYEVLYVKLKLHEVENYKGWLHTLARNYCLMQLRSPRNIKTTEFSTQFVQFEESTHLNNDMLEKEEKLSSLEDCLKTLPTDQQTSIELFFMQNKCYNEISILTGYDWNKVRSFIQNGKRNLKFVWMKNK